jgi:hypothetical protein
VLGDIHEHQFNTVIGNGFEPRHLDTLFDHGLMAVPMLTDEFFTRGVKHPSLLAWYLSDEPEGHGKSPEQIRAAYHELKAKDPNHPIGLDHFLWEGLARYKEGCDFTMTDVYPILRNRDGIITNVGKFADESRRIHGPNWPHWCHIQIFGGPDTEDGKWAQPLPHEVRCMTYIALVHRAGGILYFSYWPKAPTTWDSVTQLNKELHRLEPWLLARGEERGAKSSAPAVQVRARKIGQSWLVIAVNTEPKFFENVLHIDGVGDAKFRTAAGDRQLDSRAGAITDRFAPYEARAYLSGPEPTAE